jgi:hypothetical protein
MATPLRQQLIDEVRLMMGGQMVDIELDPEHFEMACNLALDRYRQRAGNSMEEAYMFLKILYETNVYTLPDEVMQVRQVFRRGLGEVGGGTSIDPFSLAYTNMYLLQAGAGGGYSAGLLTYELFSEYLKQAGRMFGANMNYTFDPVTKKLQLIRKPTGGETVVLWVMKVKPDDQILQDVYIRPWIRRYTLAWCKQMLGEAYSRFSNLPGPQGGVTLSGDPLKQEATAMFEQLEKEIDLYTDLSSPPGIVIG